MVPRITFAVVLTLFAATAGRHAGYYPGAVLDTLLGMKRTLVAGDALADNLAVSVNQYAHVFGPAVSGRC